MKAMIEKFLAAVLFHNQLRKFDAGKLLVLSVNFTLMLDAKKEQCKYR